MKIVATKKNDGLIINFDNDSAKYLYNRIECISFGGRGNDNFGRELSRIFHNNPKCKLIKGWEKKVYDEDPYGRKVDFGAKETREIWDLSEWFASYGVEPIDNRHYFNIAEFESGM